MSIRAESALHEVFRHRDGRALVRLLADPAFIESKALAESVSNWATRLNEVLAEELANEAVEVRSASAKIQCNRALQRVVGEQLLEALALIGRRGERKTTGLGSSPADTRPDLCS